MAPKKIYKKAYVDIVIDMALARSKISNRMAAKRLDVTEGTIRNWRNDYRDFDLAFTDARELLQEKVNKTARHSLDVRKRKTTTTGPDGVFTTVSEVLPTARDVAVFGDKLGLGNSIHGEHDEQREYLRSVMKHNLSGELTAMQAAKMLESEGISIPKTLLIEIERAANAKGGKVDELAIVLAPEQRTSRIAELQGKLNGPAEPDPTEVTG